MLDRPSRPPRVGLTLLLACVTCSVLPSQSAPGPVFQDGMAQVVPAFRDRETWIQEDLWVETTFDSNGDGKPDRVHVDVTRPGQTETDGLKVAVIYETSPYFAGVSSSDRRYFWNPNHEVGAEPPKHDLPPAIEPKNARRSGAPSGRGARSAPARRLVSTP